jgi:hypothetical protein
MTLTIQSDVFEQSLCSLARGSAVVKVLGGSRPDEANEFFSIYLFLPAALGLEVYSASNRNGYQKQSNNVSWE